MADEPEIYTREGFTEHVGTIFTLVHGDVEIELKLEGIVDQSHLAATEAEGTAAVLREPFSLTLTGPKQPQLEQQTYSLTHPVMGALNLFMKPFHEDNEARFYEVSFN